MELPLLIFSLFAMIASGVFAASASNVSAVFVYTQPQSEQPFVFALSVDGANNDLYFHMSAPSSNAWMGVGIGQKMQNSLYFIAYASSNGTGVTLSPRVASGNSEPSYYKDVTCDLIYGNGLSNSDQESNTGPFGGVSNGKMSVNAVCHNATSWKLGSSSGSLDVTSTAQPFIFAVGPSVPGGPNLRSNSLSAGLQYHDFFGQFTMDMTQATTDSGSVSVPLPNDATNSSYTNSGVTIQFAKSDSDPAPHIHAFVMCFAYFVLWPIGSLCLRVMNRVKLHAWVQFIGLVLATMGSAGGAYLSTEYNRSKNFNSPHQVLGILLFISVWAQFLLGFFHHRIYKREQRPTILGKIHRYLGPAIIFIGVVVAMLGFVLALNPHLCLPFMFFLIFVIIVYCGLRFGSRFCCSSRRNKNGIDHDAEGTTNGGPYGYQNSRFDPPPGAPPAGPYPASYMAPPPAYSRSNSYTGDDVPLAPYSSQTSGLDETRPTQPRPMV